MELEIRTFGRFLVRREDLKLSSDYGRSRKIWDLFMYLISHREKMMSPEVIIEDLWPEQDYQNARSSLKNLTHRLRQQLARGSQITSISPIVYAHGCYGWNTEYPYWLDVEVFEKLDLEARNYIVADPLKAAEKYQEMISLYKGEYLSENPYSDWIHPLRYHYHRIYINSITKLLSYLKQQQLYQQMIEVCENAFNIDEYEEGFHLYYMEALLGERETGKARAHYEYISSLFYKSFGAKPSLALYNIYRAIQEQSSTKDLDNTDIKSMLLEQERKNGPSPHDPSVFKLLCRIEIRRARSEGRTLQLGLLSLSNLTLNRVIDTAAMQDAMRHLEELLAINLRKEDIYSPWSNNQYAILLPGITREQAIKILHRVTDTFLTDHPQAELSLEGKVHSILPSEFF